MPSFDALKEDYQRRFDAMEITRPGEVNRTVDQIMRSWPRYQAIEKRTGVPAEFVASVHMRECSNDFRGCLANGQFIIGTGRKTTIVPRGRGPYATFEQSALDALQYDGAIAAFKGEARDDVALQLYEGEVFNGWGYRQQGRVSPYVWAGTDQYHSGKYVSDGVYSSRAVDPQLGIAAVIKEIRRRTAITKLPDSRGWVRADRIKKGLAGTGVGGFLTWENWTDIHSYVPWTAGLAILALGVLTYLFIHWNQQGLVTAHKEGRYEPSGLTGAATDVEPSDDDVDQPDLDAGVVPDRVSPRAGPRAHAARRVSRTGRKPRKAT